MSYIVTWSTGSLQGTLDDEHGETRLFATKEEANEAARADFARMASLSSAHMTARETLTDGLLSLSEPAPKGYAVWVEPAFWSEDGDGEDAA